MRHILLGSQKWSPDVQEPVLIAEVGCRRPGLDLDLEPAISGRAGLPRDAAWWKHRAVRVLSLSLSPIPYHAILD